MPKRLIDYEAVWSSYKLSQCKPSSRVEYLWVYGLADAGGSFDMTNLRSLWGKVSPIRPNLTFKKFKSVLADFEKHGLLFTWTIKEKQFGHWVGSRLPGRLPAPSQKSRFYFVCPEPPRHELEAYNSGVESRYKLEPHQRRGLNQDVEGIGVGKEGKSRGIGFGIGAPGVDEPRSPGPDTAQSTAAKTAAAYSPPVYEKEKTKPKTIQVGAVTITIRECPCGTVIEPRTVVKSHGRDVCKNCHREVLL
jgi:hypothetical protein